MMTPVMDIAGYTRKNILTPRKEIKSNDHSNRLFRHRFHLRALSSQANDAQEPQELLPPERIIQMLEQFKFMGQELSIPGEEVEEEFIK